MNLTGMVMYFSSSTECCALLHDKLVKFKGKILMKFLMVLMKTETDVTICISVSHAYYENISHEE